MNAASMPQEKQPHESIFSRTSSQPISISRDRFVAAPVRLFVFRRLTAWVRVGLAEWVRVQGGSGVGLAEWVCGVRPAAKFIRVGNTRHVEAPDGARRTY
eukprot:7383338-Prymnesium_polylepis.2